MFDFSLKNSAKTNLLVSAALTISVFSLSAQSKINLSGELKQGGLVIGKTAAANTVQLNGKDLAVSSTGDYVFGFGRDDQTKYTLVVIKPNGEKEQQTFSPQKRKYNEQSIKGIAKSIMQPSPESVARSKKDSGQIREARKTLSQISTFSSGFIAPIDGIITGVYGSRRIYNGVKKRPHFGLDYAGNTGDPVKAPASGQIILYVPDMFYSGGTMIIDHGHGVTSTFLHLSNAYVKVGDTVKQGQVIAAVGKSGRATGPHLDWRVNWFNTRIDPNLALKIKTINKS